jgi:hypothetical protein
MKLCSSLRFLLTVGIAMCMLIVSVSGQGYVGITSHVSDRQMFERAGYYNELGMYMGGVPEHEAKRQTDDNRCRRTITGNRTYCSYWDITQTGSNSPTDGSCKCTRGALPNNNYCAQWFCDQTVTTTYDCGGDDYYRGCTSTFDKYKSCRCVTPEPQGRFCWKWQCLGYNDGPVKTANWFCKTLASDAVPGHDTVNDFCYAFASDQYSEKVQEAKDCVCTDFSNGPYCSDWICTGRIFNNWPWWAPILGSLVGAALNLWTPFVYAAGDDCCGCHIAVIVIWTILTYLPIILVGGVPSLIANTGALALAWLVAYRDSLTLCYCSCGMRPRRHAQDYPSRPECTQPVVGTVMTNSGYSV